MRRKFLIGALGGAVAVTALFGVGTPLLSGTESATSEKNDGGSADIPVTVVKATDSSVTWTFQR